MSSTSLPRSTRGPIAAPGARGSRGDVEPSTARASTSAQMDEKVPAVSVRIDRPSFAKAPDPPSTELVALTRIARLSTYLPTGTWVGFTALQTLAFSISPDIPPTDGRNCNASQRITLIAFISMSAVFSFIQPFIKSFVLDPTGQRIIYPTPSGVEVADTIYDSVTGVTFPYSDPDSGRSIWPVADRNGRWVRQGSYVRVFVFEKRCTVIIRSQKWIHRLQAYFRRPDPDANTLSPREDDDDPRLLDPPPHSSKGTIEGELHPHLPAIIPHWRRVINGPKGEYVDLSFQVWLHALVSLFAFSSLALLSSQATKCFYPGVVDWIPVVAQMVTLSAITIAAAFVDDRAARPLHVSLCVTPCTTPPPCTKDEDNEIPPTLSPVVTDVLWVYAKKAKATV